MRLRRIVEEFAGAVTVEWRSFLLRSEPDPTLTLERFKAYTRSWLRAAADPDAGTFRVWQSDAGPPSESVTPHVIAKAAARYGREAFERMHMALLHAYFADNRDITDPETLRAIWLEVGLPAEAVASATDRALVGEVIAQHNEAIALGVSAVPAVRADGSDAFVVGAQPFDTYRRWVQRLVGAAPA